ncbi:tRNA (Guanine37-N(1)-) methyltransferase [Chthonomonas calidirosea]|uniref:tRNA (guanine-N(1)-)-methyltransferase n=1 Tax=Chthonomonas calidirosea (strain DSM 23976 / ICMP 18418 / T49) TaxID=1303518 RepID=S0EZP6_CHTCT|nr:tRNA (guanosine(37)-N1)-methyltransferase TrmD [Chthonomonas calidirosea]CCW36466.1 tRNA (Guanine37-N(1)-) methyltransferase [Chthonomonas calidirosea T49]CEK16166.1 tRNA (Guanine37-N(1)-) methyltransferase [Chthonomonas calidirosea]CEK17255.1 tRNA (Guanine37-N(1)-) methyltransferase [Chthonomonas calidirosea]
MRIDIVTLFPEMVEAVLNTSILGRAREKGLVTFRVVNLRDYATDKHRTTDDVPYGGGGGMVMKIEPIARALDALTAEADAHGEQKPRIILTDPRGRLFTQELARELAKENHLILICGHYEGVDDRVRQHLVTDVVSIGDYVLTGGELPALVIADALTRLQEGVLGDEEAPEKDSFAEPILEYPHYTRPVEFRGWRVPDILLCGHHAQIARWRRQQSLRLTRDLRPDLFNRLTLSAEDRKLLEEEITVPPKSRKHLPVSSKSLEETASQQERGKDTDGTRTRDHS